MLKRYVGDKTFYRHVLAIALPIILQNLITNFVSLLDNLMVGQLTTAEISGVTIVNNNLLFIFNICLFGGAAGAGIFTTQYHGSGNQEGIRHTFRFKLLVCTILTILGTAGFLLASDPLICLYLQGDGDPQMALDALRYGREYLYMMLWGLFPFAITTAYAGTLRECGQPTVPMAAGMVATGVNLVFNYLLIFGHFGFPAMGVRGAALATVMSRYVEAAIVIIWTHTHTEKNPFVTGLYRSLYIPKKLLRAIVIKGMPLLLNEFLWTIGMAIVNQCYSTCGLDVVPALSISSTIYNLTAVIYRSIGATVGIIMGQMLGAGKGREEILDSNRKLLALAGFSGFVFGIITAALSVVFPQLYNTSNSIRMLATQMILIGAVFMPMQAYSFPVYFTLRAGGKTGITLLFDCGSIWFLYLPIAFCLSRWTNLSILVIYALCNATDIIKGVAGHFVIKQGGWIQKLADK